GERIQHAKPVVHDRRESDDRNRVRGDREREERSAGRRPARGGAGDGKRGEAADRKPADRFDQRVAAGGRELVEVIHERRGDRAGARQQELLDPEHAHEKLPGHENGDEERGRGSVVTDAAHQLAATSTARGRAASPPRRRSRTRVMKPKYRSSSRVRSLRGCGRSTGTRSRMRPGRGELSATWRER